MCTVSSLDAGLEPSGSFFVPQGTQTVICSLCILAWRKAQGGPLRVWRRSCVRYCGRSVSVFHRLSWKWPLRWSLSTTLFDSWANWESGRLNDLSKVSNKISFWAYVFWLSVSWSLFAILQVISLCFFFPFLSSLCLLVPIWCPGGIWSSWHCLRLSAVP